MQNTLLRDTKKSTKIHPIPKCFCRRTKPSSTVACTVVRRLSSLILILLHSFALTTRRPLYSLSHSLHCEVSARTLSHRHLPYPLQPPYPQDAVAGPAAKGGAVGHDVRASCEHLPIDTRGYRSIAQSEAKTGEAKTCEDHDSKPAKLKTVRCAPLLERLLRAVEIQSRSGL